MRRTRWFSELKVFFIPKFFNSELLHAISSQEIHNLDLPWLCWLEHPWLCWLEHQTSPPTLTSSGSVLSFPWVGETQDTKHKSNTKKLREVNVNKKEHKYKINETLNTKRQTSPPVLTSLGSVLSFPWGGETRRTRWFSELSHTLHHNLREIQFRNQRNIVYKKGNMVCRIKEILVLSFPLGGETRRTRCSS